MGHLAGTALVARLAMIGSVGVSAVELSGCDVIDDVEHWIPTGEDAVNAILAVLTANNIPVSVAVSATAGLIETGLNDLLAAVKEYQSTTPPPVGALQKIQTILQDISDNFSTFTSQLSGTAGNILKVVEALAQVVISTIGGFVSQLGTSTALRVNLKLNGMTVAPVKRTRRRFKKDWNAQLNAAKASGIKIPSAAYLHLSPFKYL